MRKLRTSSSVTAIDPLDPTGVLLQIVDCMKGLQGDIANIAAEYNAEVRAPLSTLPQGRSETRWSLDDTICPRINGFDAGQLFVDNDATAATGNDLFWDDANSRPSTVKEFLESLYSRVENAVNILAAENIVTSTPTLTVYDEGTEIEATVGSVDFRGAGVTVTRTDEGAVRVTIPAASSSGSVSSYYSMSRCNLINPSSYVTAETYQGSCIFDASTIPAGFTAYFCAVIYSFAATSGGDVILYDLGDGSGGTIAGGRVVSTITLDNPVGSWGSRQALSVVAASATTNELLSESRTYMVLITPAGAGNIIVNAGIEVRPTT